MTGGAPPPPDAWAGGLTKEKQYEFLVDVYRLRVDDDYAWGGGWLHGLYDQYGDATTILEDFLIFCKMAAHQGVIPPGWDWHAFLSSLATGDLIYAFEKSDASEKWGGENVFQAFLGGRSLRYTGETVYGLSCQEVAADEEEPPALADVRALVEGRWQALVRGRGSAALFGDVGGVVAWRALEAALPHIPGRGG